MHFNFMLHGLSMVVPIWMMAFPTATIWWADTASAETVALIADRVVDGRADKPQEKVAIVVEGNRIVGIGDAAAVPVDARIIELPGTTLMPGMINAHEHSLMFSDDYQNAHLHGSSAYKALMGLAAMQAQLQAGWTTIRVMGDIDVHYANQDIRKVIEAGVLPVRASPGRDTTSLSLAAAATSTLFRRSGQ